MIKIFIALTIASLKNMNLHMGLNNHKNVLFPVNSLLMEGGSPEAPLAEIGLKDFRYFSELFFVLNCFVGFKKNV